MVMVLLHRIAMKLYIILRQLVSEYLNQNAKTIFIVQIFLQVDKKKKNLYQPNKYINTINNILLFHL